MSVALTIVDMQNYYLSKSGSFYSYYESKDPGSMNYINKKAFNTVVPNIIRLKNLFKSKNLPVYYLRLCGTKADRSDLHRFFKIAHERAEHEGFENLYPLAGDKDANIIDELAPSDNDMVFTKTTFSPFNSTNINQQLQSDNIRAIVFTGLATSQCVETSARDASDKGFSIIHINDAQVDYTEESHYSSLYSSQPVCGGWIFETEYFVEHFDSLMHNISVTEHSIEFID